MSGKSKARRGRGRGKGPKPTGFECPKCGCKRLEEVMAGVSQSTAIEGVDEDGLVYGHSSTEGGEIDRFQCLECGEVVRDGDGLAIASPESLVAWIEEQGKRQEAHGER